MGSNDDDGFKLITGKKKIRKKIFHRIDSNMAPLIVEDHVDLDKFEKKLSKISLEMESSLYFNVNLSNLHRITGMKTIRKFEKFLCLGIGSFTTNINSLHQLAFFMSLCKQLDLTDIEYYDPVLSKAEKQFLEKHNIKVTPKNLLGFYPIYDLTLVCLPHCPSVLTNNLIWGNWNLEALENIVLFCNSFSTIFEHVERPEEIVDMKRISTYTQEVLIENNYHLKDIFNNMSYHIFTIPDDLKFDRKFWTKKVLPDHIYKQFRKQYWYDNNNVK